MQRNGDLRTYFLLPVWKCWCNMTNACAAAVICSSNLKIQNNQPDWIPILPSRPSPSPNRQTQKEIFSRPSYPATPRSTPDSHDLTQAQQVGAHPACSDLSFICFVPDSYLAILHNLTPCISHVRNPKYPIQHASNGRFDARHPKNV